MFSFPRGLAKLGLVDREKASDAFDLAVPAMITGGMRTLLRTADFFMVSVAVGEAAVAALEFGFQYYFIAFGLALAMTSGTISVVSRFKGADEHARADLAVKQSLWLAIAIAVPLTTVSWVYAEPLIALLGASPEVVDLGATYLRIVMLAAGFRIWSMVAARALAGSGDTRTPMYVRLVTLPTNVGLNAVLIFGLGPVAAMGVAGAAWGTAIANTLAAVIFLVLFLSGRFAVGLRIGGRQVDLGIATEIVRVASPLAGTRLAQTFSRFPFLFALALLGTEFVAAYAIARRVILLALMPAWGYSTAASTLVGQAIGGGDDREATEYGWQTLRIALATQLIMAVLLAFLARPITIAFGTQNVDLTVAFMLMFAVSVAGFSISRTMRGSLRGAGDTRWPFYGTLAGAWLVRLPIAFAALSPGQFTVAVLGTTLDPGLGLGAWGIFAAILADMYLRGLVNLVRFRSGKWQIIARESDVGADAPG
jgi:putative MATE family efflux protein